MTELDQLNRFLFRNSLAKETDTIVWTALTGGVSSYIWRVDLPGRTICVKRAAPRLRVDAEWLAPVERNKYEWEWFRFVAANFPGLVPTPIAHDPVMKMFAMEYLPPDDYVNWKSDLLAGKADAEFAGKVGTALGDIHAKAAGDPRLQELFSTDMIFFDLRIEPYLLATSKKHPDLALDIQKTADQLLKTRISLVHGDVSPKNILKGLLKPIFLDAETAWYGDPAFDIAFCLNHILLKTAFLPNTRIDLENCFHSLTSNYMERVSWEPPSAIEQRVIKLLPILLLARVDGKSPAEYLNEGTRLLVRSVARTLAKNPPASDLTAFFNDFIVRIVRAAG